MGGIVATETIADLRFVDSIMRKITEGLGKHAKNVHPISKLKYMFTMEQMSTILKF